MIPPPGPFPPQYDAEQVAAIERDELRRHRARTTPATLIVAAVLGAGALWWISTIALSAIGR